MRRADRRQVDVERFETTSLTLASALLSQIPGAAVLSIAPEPSIDGKRLIVINYPSDEAQKALNLVRQFHARTLSVPLYPYNRVLNALRDRLKQDTGNHALR
jgi:hypothetical protein